MTVCKYCGNNFVATSGGEKYCSVKCQYRWKLAFSTASMTPFEEMEMKMYLREEQRERTCEGCAYIGSSKCGNVKQVQHSSSSVSYMKFRDSRCKEK